MKLDTIKSIAMSFGDVSIISKTDVILDIFLDLIEQKETRVIADYNEEDEYLLLNLFNNGVITISNAIFDYKVDTEGMIRDNSYIDSDFIKDFTSCNGELDLTDLEVATIFTLDK